MATPRISSWQRALAHMGEGEVWLAWIVRLRWVAIVAQILTVSVVARLFDAMWSVAILVGAVGVLVLANLFARRRLLMKAPVNSRLLLGQLVLDIVVLSTFLVFSGGPTNPFTVLYLVHIAMGSVILPARYAAVLTAAVIACYGGLHFTRWPLHLDRHPLGEPTLLLLGNLVAITITAVTVSYFVLGLASSLRHRERLLLEAQERTARTDRLRSVGTMAAGAAHELNTPLSTVALRLRRVTRRHDDAATQADLAAIRGQLDRCNEIVQQLLVGAGDPSASHLMRGHLAEFVDDAVSMWSHGNGVDVHISDDSAEAVVEIPRTAFIQGLVNLLENAREAQAEVDSDAPIEVELVSEGEMATVIVRDHGPGMPDLIDRVGEPFLTTKPTGTGLGVFVARAVADGSGGGLRYRSEPGCTEALWSFPTSVRRPA